MHLSKMDNMCVCVCVCVWGGGGGGERERERVCMHVCVVCTCMCVCVCVSGVHMCVCERGRESVHVRVVCTYVCVCVCVLSTASGSFFIILSLKKKKTEIFQTRFLDMYFQFDLRHMLTFYLYTEKQLSINLS